MLGHQAIAERALRRASVDDDDSSLSLTYLWIRVIDMHKHTHGNEEEVSPFSFLLLLERRFCRSRDRVFPFDVGLQQKVMQKRNDSNDPFEEGLELW